MEEQQEDKAVQELVNNSSAASSTATLIAPAQPGQLAFSSLRAHLDQYLNDDGVDNEVDNSFPQYDAQQLPNEPPAASLNENTQSPQSSKEVLTLESLRGLSPPEVRRVLSQSGMERPPLQHSMSKDSFTTSTTTEDDVDVHSEPNLDRSISVPAPHADAGGILISQYNQPPRFKANSVSSEVALNQLRSQFSVQADCKQEEPKLHYRASKQKKKQDAYQQSQRQHQRKEHHQPTAFKEPNQLNKYKQQQQQQQQHQQLQHSRTNSVVSSATNVTDSTEMGSTAASTVNTASLANLSYDLKKLLGQPELCDVSFVVGKQLMKIIGVRAILAARSSVFKTMLYGIKGHRQTEFFLPLEDGPAFKKMVKFIHTGKVSVEAATCDALLECGRKYAVTELVRIVTEYQEHTITVASVIGQLNTAYETQDTDLYNRCLRFFETHASKIFRTPEFQSGILLEDVLCTLLKADQLLVESEMEVYQAVVQWGRACYSRGMVKERTLKRHVADIIKRPIALVRFGIIPISTIIQEIAKEGLVPTSVLLEAVAHQTDPQAAPVKSPMFRPRATKKASEWLTWDDALKDSELQVSQDGTSVSVIPGLSTNRPRNILSAVPLERGSHRWRMRVEGPNNRPIFVCLGVMINSTQYKINPFCAKEICSFSSCMNIYGHRISGAPISLENGAIAELVLNLEKRVLYVKKEGSIQYDMRLRTRSGPCRLFASLVSTDSKVTLLPY